MNLTATLGFLLIAYYVNQREARQSADVSPLNFLRYYCFFLDKFVFFLTKSFFNHKNATATRLMFFHLGCSLLVKILHFHSQQEFLPLQYVLCFLTDNCEYVLVDLNPGRKNSDRCSSFRNVLKPFLAIKNSRRIFILSMKGRMLGFVSICI